MPNTHMELYVLICSDRVPGSRGWRPVPAKMLVISCGWDMDDGLNFGIIMSTQ